MDEVAEVLGAIGPRLRAMRRARGLTLADLAGRVGMSVSGLSRLESGRRRPTLDLLLPLAADLRVGLEELVGSRPTGDPRVHLTAHRRTDGSVVGLTRYPGGITVFKQVLRPRPVRWSSHEGWEWMYVLAGSVRLLLDEDEAVLDPGDAVEFDTGRRHWFGPAGEQEVEILHLFGPQGQRIRWRG